MTGGGDVTIVTRMGAYQLLYFGTRLVFPTPRPLSVVNLRVGGHSEWLDVTIVTPLRSPLPVTNVTL
jgi:hypothetical protein